MDIVTYFDPYNTDHLEAYRHLQDVGTWPNGFIPEGIAFNQAWQALIAFKMAALWVKFRLDRRI